MKNERLWTREDLKFDCSNDSVNEAMGLFTSVLLVISLKLDGREMNEFTMHAMKLMNKVDDIEKRTAEEGIQ